MGDTSDREEGRLMELLRFLEAVGAESLTSTEDWVFELLKDEQRRYLVLYLSEQETPTPISRVAADVASRCNDTPVSNVTPSEQERVRVRLEQEHLPRLGDYGIISWSYGEDVVDPIPSLLSSDEE
ncbi:MULTISPECIES: DUF7344 domain-containing protein [Haladaptatus]|uniref:DUF7344 domain-containing protein n=2 Tax=Haladaptatus paucihalophilus DX253 TaxID=797209 RepID=A0A1M6PH06_HALPU|nr:MULTISPECIES: hypothetical protein [Haladaptatus]GKZ13433.1 hypothetical protein HAL_13140 [Haladaptatus sp. T7]SHK07231.1 hypothetical protein SAMN05444342_0479 [Haladaptatus paucihalophilus DX253]